MATINDNFQKLPVSYLFTDIAHKVAEYKQHNPDADIIRLGIGDVTQPLCPAVIEALHKAVDEMGQQETFRGYGPEHGYSFLQDAIIENDFRTRGIELTRDEVFINDGAKSDTGNIGDILGLDNHLIMTDPIYPVYVDSNAMCGRAGDPILSPDGSVKGWSRITYCPCNAENNFTPVIPAPSISPQRGSDSSSLSSPLGEETGGALIYLCYPNNPTGTVISKAELKKWVDYALATDSIIMYDAAYEAYIQEKDIPHSIYEIPDAKKCAIEFHSYSKTAGFTGVRCGYTIVPLELTALNKKGERIQLNPLWNRRQCTKFNGTSYIQQRAAEAIYTQEGKAQVKSTIAYYMENARIMREALESAGMKVWGGVNAPYIWLKTPDGVSSWQFFDQLLQGPHIVGTPGVGFGPSGEGYFRLTAFGQREDCIRAMQRLR